MWAGSGAGAPIQTGLGEMGGGVGIVEAALGRRDRGGERLGAAVREEGIEQGRPSPRHDACMSVCACVACGGGG